MASSGMLRRVALVRTDVSEEFRASFIRVTKIELGTTLAVASNRRTLRRHISYNLTHAHLNLLLKQCLCDHHAVYVLEIPSRINV
jgi:hypothetical protein